MYITSTSTTTTTTYYYLLLLIVILIAIVLILTITPRAILLGRGEAEEAQGPAGARALLARVRSASLLAHEHKIRTQHTKTNNYITFIIMTNLKGIHRNSQKNKNILNKNKHIIHVSRHRINLLRSVVFWARPPCSLALRDSSKGGCGGSRVWFTSYYRLLYY